MPAARICAHPSAPSAAATSRPTRAAASAAGPGPTSGARCTTAVAAPANYRFSALIDIDRDVRTGCGVEGASAAGIECSVVPHGGDHTFPSAAEVFATALPWFDWQTSEQPTALPGLAARIATAALPNLPPPLALDAGAATWPPLAADHAYTANTAHILSWDGVVAMFGGLARVLAPVTKALAGKPFLLGEKFSVADVVMGGVLQWANASGLLVSCPEVCAYHARLSERPAYKRALL